jgi:hypothetical protein
MVYHKCLVCCGAYVQFQCVRTSFHRTQEARYGVLWSFHWDTPMSYQLGHGTTFVAVTHSAAVVLGNSENNVIAGLNVANGSSVSRCDREWVRIRAAVEKRTTRY